MRISDAQGQDWIAAAGAPPAAGAAADLFAALFAASTLPPVVHGPGTAGDQPPLAAAEAESLPGPAHPALAGTETHLDARRPTRNPAPAAASLDPSLIPSNDAQTGAPPQPAEAPAAPRPDRTPLGDAGLGVRPATGAPSPLGPQVIRDVLPSDRAEKVSRSASEEDHAEDGDQPRGAAEASQPAAPALPGEATTVLHPSAPAPWPEGAPLHAAAPAAGVRLPTAPATGARLPAATASARQEPLPSFPIPDPDEATAARHEVAGAQLPEPRPRVDETPTRVSRIAPPPSRMPGAPAPAVMPGLAAARMPAPAATPPGLRAETPATDTPVATSPDAAKAESPTPASGHAERPDHRAQDAPRHQVAEPAAPPLPALETNLAAPPAPATETAPGIATPSGPGALPDPAAREAVAEMALPEPLSTLAPDWPAEVGNRLAEALDSGLSELEIVLAPESLGRLKIRVELQDGTAQVRFTTETAEAARLLAGQEGRLAELLDRGGLSLARHEAGQGDTGPRHEPPPDRGPRRAAPRPLPDTPDPAAPAAGLVNLIA